MTESTGELLLTTVDSNIHPMKSPTADIAHQADLIAAEVFEYFVNHNEWPVATSFKADRLGEIDISAFDQLEGSGRLFVNDGRYEVGFRDIVRHQAWIREERICNGLLETLRGYFKANPEQPVPIERLFPAERIGTRESDIRRALYYLSKLSYVGLSHSGQILVGARPYENVWRHKMIAAAIAHYHPNHKTVEAPRYVVRDLKKEFAVGGTGKAPGNPVSGLTFNLLHDAVREASQHHFHSANYRDAVLNAFISVFDLIREKSGLTQDGHALVNNSFSVARPVLMINALSTESDRNEQLGFMDLLKGAYTGIRSPKAHSLKATVKDPIKAFEYLALASLMARTIESSKKNER